jgi:diadenosine tetraphosphate (Ap4A) HIT family hydrolase
MARTRIAQLDTSAAGYNVGFNDGTVAGQTVMHAHIHVIPRRAGDVADPTGGVRNVIPGMGRY